MDTAFRLSDWNHHIRYSDPFRYYAGGTILVTLKVGGQLRKIFHITLAKDRSIFMQSPYFEHVNGILTALTFRGEVGMSGQYALSDGGVATNHRVKLSHHVDGYVHFSQDGRLQRALRKQSFRLDGPSGHLCQMQAWGIDSFDAARSRDVTKRTRPLIMFEHRGALDGITLILDWIERTELVDILGARAGPIGPYIVHGYPDDPKARYFVLASHAREPKPTHFLSIAMRTVNARPRGADGPGIFLVGGLDSASLSPRLVKQGRALAWLYPRSTTTDVPSVDYIGA